MRCSSASRSRARPAATSTTRAAKASNPTQERHARPRYSRRRPARMVERLTRCTQNALPVRACGFESRSGHHRQYFGPMCRSSVRHRLPTGDVDVPPSRWPPGDPESITGLAEDREDVGGVVRELVAVVRGTAARPSRRRSSPRQPSLWISPRRRRPGCRSRATSSCQRSQHDRPLVLPAWTVLGEQAEPVHAVGRHDDRARLAPLVRLATDDRLDRSVHLLADSRVRRGRADLQPLCSPSAARIEPSPRYWPSR